ncbi:glycoside hydrolase family 65 protein [Cetobacterium sp.]|uniref:glycoside hydrolase family 65 protein n=1 Tax=Cetobacterium sp. TaxID=2071632 RepID=UPI003F3327D3
MNYVKGKNELKNWVVSESSFNTNHLGKCEAIMCLGNGYMGVRSSTEEKYLKETRDHFVSGTFNKFDENEVTELPNIGDFTALEILLNGDRLDLEKGEVKNYSRDLNLKTGLITREFNWTFKGVEYHFVSRRFVSLKDLNLMAIEVAITPINSDAKISISSGINGQVSNSGAQHFHEGEKRIYNKKFVEMISTTTTSKIDFIQMTTHKIKLASKELHINPELNMDRRKVSVIYDVDVKAGVEFKIEKLCSVNTTRDLVHIDRDLKEIRTYALNQLENFEKVGFDTLLEASKVEWNKKWDAIDIKIDSAVEFDQLSIRFAQYHLIAMTPAHDSRMGVGAKGLSGEGYKGHSFWDTELFLMPFFSYTMPEVAKSLAKYRFETLNGARKKATDNGYTGAMFPWESAWKDDGEVTPVWGAVDIITGKATKIQSGFIEQHITCDVAYALWQYYMVTKDEEFMENYGFEILFDTAIFWASRLEWNSEKNEYHINNVIGPDEYKEHINNNAFTNYMAHWNLNLAIEYYSKIKSEKPAVFNTLNEKLDLDSNLKVWKDKSEKIYLPVPRKEDSVIPQDDTYLTKEIIDLTKYKNQEHVGSLFKDYSLDQVNNIQVSKQADIMVLFYLLENKFSTDVKKANWNYYEPKTLHDSSLSLSTHCVLASDMNDKDMAYDLFRRASEIDLGPNMKTSDHGIHAASLGGIWQCIVNGFSGVRMLGGELRIDPKLPENWNEVSFPLNWHGVNLKVTVDKEVLTVVRNSDSDVEVKFTVHGNEYILDKKIEIKY